MSEPNSMQMHGCQASRRDDAKPGVEPEAKASDRPVSRVPNNYIGKLLDQGQPSAAALKLLAVKYALGGPGFVVSERLAKAHGMGWREYRSGLNLLVVRGIIHRRQEGRRSFPKERLVTAASRNYTKIEVALLALPANVVAFILAANLAPKPARPAELCGRLGISSEATIRKITEAAIVSGAVAVWRPRKGPRLVARPGTVFDVMQSGHPVKSGATKNGATLSSREILSESERDSSSPNKSHSLMGGAAGLLKGGLAEDLKSELVEELRAADHAGALHACLLSPKGVEGYQALVREHGVAALSVVLAKLSAFAIDGATPGQIWTWNYFREAIADEVKHTWMTEKGVRPGDVGSLQRELKLEAKNGRHGRTPRPTCPTRPAATRGR